MIVNGVVINLDDISPPFGTVITETGLTSAGTITANHAVSTLATA